MNDDDGGDEDNEDEEEGREDEANEPDEGTPISAFVVFRLDEKLFKMSSILNELE
jgi:hypothetical protein